METNPLVDYWEQILAARYLRQEWKWSQEFVDGCIFRRASYLDARCPDIPSATWHIYLLA